MEILNDIKYHFNNAGRQRVRTEQHHHLASSPQRMSK